MINNLDLRKNQYTLGSFMHIVFYIYLFVAFLFNHTLLYQITLLFYSAFMLFIIIIDGKFYINYYFIFNAIFIAYCYLTYRYMNFDISSLKMLQTLIYTIIANFFIFNFIVYKNNIEKILKTIVALAIVIFIIIFFANIDTLTLGRIANTTYIFNIAIDLNANTFGMLMAFSLIITVYFLIKYKNNINYLLIALFLIGSLISGSRKALIICFLGAFLILIIMFKRKRVSIILFCIFLSLIGFLIITQISFFYDIIGYRFMAIFDFLIQGETNEGSLTTRVAMINKAIELFKKEPIFGHGLNSFTLLGGFNTYSHNNYVEILVNSGIIGFLLYYTPLFVLLQRSYKHYKNHNDELCGLMFTLILIKLIMDYFAVSYFERMDLLLYLVGFSYLQIVKIRLEKEKKKNEYIKVNKKSL